jgi:uncharacterized protein (UPF0210 family)
MRIRTITLGLPGKPDRESIRWAGEQLARAVRHFESLGYTVQTRRAALEHWDTGPGRLSRNEREDLFLLADSLCAEHQIDFCSAGIVRDPEQIAGLVRILVQGKRLSASADLASVERGIHEDSIRAAAEGMCYLAEHTEGGLGNFRFAGGFCLRPGNPFFPGAYHAAPAPGFGIGLENSDLLVKAMALAGERGRAAEALYQALTSEFQKVEQAALEISKMINVEYQGIDTSIAPSLDPQESIARAFRAVQVEFGAAGTLALCSLITDVLKKIPVRKVGYCGLMLSVLEDTGLAAVAGEGKVRIAELLSYAGVCGVGLDLVPVPGEVKIAGLCNLLLDVATLSTRLSKPLSARIVPVPGKKAGDPTAFDSPYLCNSRVMEF